MVEAPLFGTRELYDRLAAALNDDPAWLKKSRELDYTMTHVYTSPIDKVFSFRFDKGKLVDVTEVDAGGEVTSDFVLTATPQIWEKVLVSQQLSANIALVTGKIKVKGKMGVLLKNMSAFNYLLEVLCGLEPVLSRV
jgi:putative sterol carrier protein